MSNLSLIGTRLLGERKRLRLSQQEAADIAGVTREHWGRCERGAAIPGGEVLAAFGLAGADVGFVLTGRRAAEVESTSAVIDPAVIQQAVLDAVELLSLGAAINAGQLAKAVAMLCARGPLAASPSAQAAQTFNAPVLGGVAGRDIVNKGRK